MHHNSLTISLCLILSHRGDLRPAAIWSYLRSATIILAANFEQAEAQMDVSDRGIAPN